MQCHGCGKKGHLLKECNKTPAKKKEYNFAMMKSGGFKTTKKGVVNIQIEEDPKEPPEDATQVSARRKQSYLLIVCGFLWAKPL